MTNEQFMKTLDENLDKLKAIAEKQLKENRKLKKQFFNCDEKLVE